MDWIAIIFKPSFPYRLLHTVIAFFVTTAFVVIGVAGCTSVRGSRLEESLMMLKMGARAHGASSCRCRCSSATSTASTRSSTSR